MKQLLDLKEVICWVINAIISAQNKKGKLSSHIAKFLPLTKKRKKENKDSLKNKDKDQKIIVGKVGAKF